MRFLHERSDLLFVGAVVGTHVVCKRNKEIVVSATGQLCLYVGLAAPEENWANAFTELVEMLIARRTAFVVENIIIAIKTKKRAEESGIEKIDNGFEFIDPIFNRRTRENERITAAQSFDGLDRKSVV